MKKHFIAQKVMGIIVFAFAFIVGLSFAVMAIWNNVLVPVLHVETIGFWQALGIFGLAKILFGGFPGGGRFGPGRRWKAHMAENMRDKWMNMSEEDREKLKQRMKGRCERWSRPSNEAADATE